MQMSEQLDQVGINDYGGRLFGKFNQRAIDVEKEGPVYRRRRRTLVPCHRHATTFSPRFVRD